jgi:4-amino-4-deoxy-L-arabinose transferase-like glycosyltransferase
MSFSWETTSPPAPAAPAPPIGARGNGRSRLLARAGALAARVPRPELAALLVLAGVLNLASLARNGWANEYYAAAVRSMSASWHNFLFASLDGSGVMTVDKPPLALWVQALSVRLFGYHPLSMLVPQALMGVASVALVYDLVRRRFGRIGGFVGGLALALTPITVAISRHNNPDALLVLCCVGALWCAVRALEDPRTRWLVLAGVCVGLGFETKMGVALAVVPGIAAAWLWIAPAARSLKGLRARGHALGQLLCAGAAMLLVGGAWPALVELVPATDRPWISGTSDNRVLSLIFGYNGLGRVDGQTGGPGGGGGGTMFGGAPGPLRLLNSALGGQSGWLLGFAIVGGVGLVVVTRLRREDARSGWLLVVGGAFATTAVLFSAASGIFHPYYVSLLAPFAAALVGATAAELISGQLNARVVGPLAVAGGVACELIVRADYPGQLTWLPTLLIALGALAAIALLASGSRAVRVAAVALALAALLIAPAAWAFDTLGHATSATFPEGGPASVAAGGFGGPGAGFGGFGARASARGRAGGVGIGGASAAPQLFGTGAGAAGSASGSPTAPPSSTGLPGPPAGGGAARGLGAGAPGGGAIGAPLGTNVSLTKVLAYVKRHGGGTIAVSSQSSAASSIIREGASVAGIGGFSGRESDVSASWLAHEVSSHEIRWVLAEQSAGGFGGHLPGDTRTGAQTAMTAAAKVCTKAPVSTSSATGAGALYDCQGHAQALASTHISASARESTL